MSLFANPRAQPRKLPLSGRMSGIWMLLLQGHSVFKKVSSEKSSIQFVAHTKAISLFKSKACVKLLSSFVPRNVQCCTARRPDPYREMSRLIPLDGLKVSPVMIDRNSRRKTLFETNCFPAERIICPDFTKNRLD